MTIGLMHPPTQEELDRLRADQRATLLDQCRRLVRSSTEVDRYNKPIEAWVADEYLPCGYSAKAKRKVMASTEVTLTDGALRLPWDTTLGAHDRIQVTRRRGVELDPPLTFSLLGEPERGLTGVTVDLRLVTDERAAGGPA